jgi:hypothetical protein
MDMDITEHKERHRVLHKYLDELVADFISNTKQLPSSTVLSNFMIWAHKQIENPDEYKGK